MTWILGSGVLWGYGALIADVRVTWPDGRHLDCLQKIYAVGPWMMAGFAGSVDFGLQSIADMRSAFSSTGEGGMWMPEVAAHRWRRRARRAFAKAPAEVKDLRSSLILVGVSPARSEGPALTCCLRMRSPDFEPERASAMSWLSIGTGASHELAERYAKMTMSEFANGVGKSEINNPGGTASAVAGLVARRLAEAPVATVSDRLLVGTAWTNRFEIMMLDTRQHGSGWSTWSLVKPEGLADSISAFHRQCGIAGLTPGAASA